MNKIIIVSGPTASGKSALAIDIAKKLNSQIVSADSMQIYRYMDIGTAKITESEMQNIKHYMLDVVNPDQEYSVSDYASTVKDIIANMHKNNMIPIICGGTGLYIDSILYPLSLGAKDDLVRQKYQKEYETYGATYIHDKLKAIDPKEAEKVHENNVKRVIRALEIYELTGKTKSEQKDRNESLQYDTLLITLNPDKETLYQRIDKRVDEMFDMGLVSEVKGLLDKGYGFDLQSMQAIGYKEFKGYFEGTDSLDYVKDEIKKGSRHYAKRQVTWFKRYPFANMCDINEKDEIMKLVDNFVRK